MCPIGGINSLIWIDRQTRSTVAWHSNLSSLLSQKISIYRSMPFRPTATASQNTSIYRSMSFRSTFSIYLYSTFQSTVACHFDLLSQNISIRSMLVRFTVTDISIYHSMGFRSTVTGTFRSTVACPFDLPLRSTVAWDFDLPFYLLPRVNSFYRSNAFRSCFRVFFSVKRAIVGEVNLKFRSVQKTYEKNSAASRPAARLVNTVSRVSISHSLTSHSCRQS